MLSAQCDSDSVMERMQLLRLLFARGAVKAEELPKDTISDETVAALNDSLESMHFAVRQMRYEHDAAIYLVLTNTKAADDVKLCALLNENQIIFFKELLENILHNQGEIKHNEALSMSITKKKPNGDDWKVSKQDRERAISSLLEHNWLLPDKAVYRLSPRAIVELGTYIDSINERVQCTICKEKLLSPTLCQNPDCRAPFHTYCAKSWYWDQKKDYCPRCKAKQQNLEPDP